jgi:hypothetical protein
MSFTRNKEDFTCGQCGIATEGTGYTNHCHACLWSRHVDKDPGDRAADCGGMMRPVSVEGSTPEYVILHECADCGFQRRNKVQDDDSVSAVLDLVVRKA